MARLLWAAAEPGIALEGGSPVPGGLFPPVLAGGRDAGRQGPGGQGPRAGREGDDQGQNEGRDDLASHAG